mmetsp:Transcript_77118/g.249638  ORF Transcript_77118/g.249638 Transcript_77118/m.249638 type:complete len:216 (+) Transcript_77118:95-742(+)
MDESCIQEGIILYRACVEQCCSLIDLIDCELASDRALSSSELSTTCGTVRKVCNRLAENPATSDPTTKPTTSQAIRSSGTTVRQLGTIVRMLLYSAPRHPLYDDDWITLKMDKCNVVDLGKADHLLFFSWGSSVILPMAMVLPSSRRVKRPSCCTPLKVSRVVGRAREMLHVTTEPSRTNLGFCSFFVRSVKLMLSYNFRISHSSATTCAWNTAL